MKKIRRTARVMAMCSVGWGLPSAHAAPPKSTAEIDKRVESLLKRMTLEEKVDYLGGVNGFFVRANPRLRLPALKMADGPLGIRNWGPSTGYPGGIALAATWDVDLA